METVISNIRLQDGQPMTFGRPEASRRTPALAPGPGTQIGQKKIIQ